ncbi:hypothetical protein [Nitrosopumilus sp.]|uniref:hypothetical protein n=1 Tax=Nitrosopumilus sp. TaxID=2024843 RepID=UPI002930D369|nr:hypothetical protein [Nitrosopumilus sp.]
MPTSDPGTLARPKEHKKRKIKIIVEGIASSAIPHIIAIAVTGLLSLDATVTGEVRSISMGFSSTTEYMLLWNCLE